MSSPRPWLEQLRAGSEALQGVLSAVLEAERHFSPPASPLERLKQITTSPEWAWLQPLYRLIADIDQRAGLRARLPWRSAAVWRIRATAQRRRGVAAEQAFLLLPLLLQSDPAVAMARGGGCVPLPAEATNQSERLHARHQWTARRRFLRLKPPGRGAS